LKTKTRKQQHGFMIQIKTKKQPLISL